MRFFRSFTLLLLAGFSIGCSNVRVALYDSEKRQLYAEETKSAYLQTESGKTFTLRHSMVDTAHDYLGSPYKYGGMDARKGFDCSGFVYTVARKNQLELPRSSSLMAGGGPHVAWKKADAGDLVFFGDHGRIHHVGIIEKNNGRELHVIHSTSQRGVISENVLASSYWKKRVLFAVEITSFVKGKGKA